MGLCVNNNNNNNKQPGCRIAWPAAQTIRSLTSLCALLVACEVGAECAQQVKWNGLKRAWRCCLADVLERRGEDSPLTRHASYVALRTSTRV